MADAKGKRVADLAQDRPIDREIDDRLDRISFVENLILALVRDEKDISGHIVARRSTGVVVGLTGKWGSGKTSILNLIAERLKKTDHVAVATLNPWLFKGRDELLAAFFGELRDALGRSAPEHARELVAAMDTYREAITVAGHFAALAADAAGAGGLATAGRVALKQALKLIRKPKELSPQEERRKLERKDNHAIAEDATTYLFRLGVRDKTKVERVKRVAEALLASGDLIILPDMLRKHLFQWGLTVHRPAEGGRNYIFTKKETEDLLAKSIPIFRAALLDGTLLRRIPNSDAIFALSNTRNWDDDLRKSLTAQLDCYEGRASIAGLIVPPGYSADRSSLDQLFDAETVLARMRAAKEGISTGSWSEQNLRRLRAILAGKNPSFASVDGESDDDEAHEAEA